MPHPLNAGHGVFHSSGNLRFDLGRRGAKL
jgi:hypothetical protein